MPKGGRRIGAGRPPKPTAIKKLEGNPGGRPLNFREPIAVSDAPRRPAEVKGRARREWDLIVPDLRKLGVLATCDRAALAAYALAAGRFFDLTHELNQMGEWAFTSQGEIEINRLARRRDIAESAMLRFLLEFGLTPASRSRVIAAAEAADDHEDDAGEAFLRQRRGLRVVGGSEESE